MTSAFTEPREDNLVPEIHGWHQFIEDGEWTILTAWRADDGYEANAANTALLHIYLDNRGLRFSEVEGVWEGGRERAFLIEEHLPLSEIIIVMRAFEQQVAVRNDGMVEIWRLLVPEATDSLGYARRVRPLRRVCRATKRRTILHGRGGTLLMRVFDVDFIMDYESAAETMSTKDILEGFADGIANGIVWGLQGSYGRQAQAFIDSGLITDNGTITPKGKEVV